MSTLQKISPHLWFDTQAEDAVKFYVSIFKESKIGRVNRYGEAGRDVHRMQPGMVMSAQFWLEGQEFLALNGGPLFKFNESISFVINCDDQEEIDYYWEKLTEGGDPKAQRCGWLKDKFGLSWQVVPKELFKIFGTDGTKSQKVMPVFMQMNKIDIARLQEAYDS